MIHSANAAIVASDSFACPRHLRRTLRPGGWRGSAGSSRDRRARWPGPSRRLSRARRGSRAAGPPSASSVWHSKHVSTRTGLMFASKNSICCGVGAPHLLAVCAADIRIAAVAAKDAAGAGQIHDRERSRNVMMDVTRGTGYYAASVSQIPMRILTLLTLLASVSRSHVRSDPPHAARHAPTKAPRRDHAGRPHSYNEAQPGSHFRRPRGPDWMAIDEDVWVSNSPKNSVSRLDPKSNTVDDLRRRQEPRFRAGRRLRQRLGPELRRLDHHSPRSEGWQDAGDLPADDRGRRRGVTIGAGSFWILTDTKGTLARVDPATNKVVAEIYVAPGSFAVGLRRQRRLGDEHREERADAGQRADAT